MIDFIRKRKRFFIGLLAVLVLLWTVAIFAQSAKNGEKSSDDTNKVIEIIENVVEKIDPDVEVSSHIVRKLAHFCEYLVLGVSVAALVATVGGRWLYIGAWGYAVSVAFCDEFAVQRFSEGRAPQLTDVLIDSAGAFLGVLAIAVLTYIIMKRKSEADT